MLPELLLCTQRSASPSAASTCSNTLKRLRRCTKAPMRQWGGSGSSGACAVGFAAQPGARAAGAVFSGAGLGCDFIYTPK
jgi:hypothetical protein